jgi:hypothetical protein
VCRTISGTDDTKVIGGDEDRQYFYGGTPYMDKEEGQATSGLYGVDKKSRHPFFMFWAISRGSTI